MLKKEAKKKAKVIVSFDNYTEESYALKGKTLTPHKKLAPKSNLFLATYLANKDIIIAPIEIGSGIPDEDLDGTIVNKAYEELGLDPTLEYIINHHEIDHSGEGRLFQLFIVERDHFVEIFSAAREKIKYIDLITPAPLLYKTLYSREIVERKGVQCYLYFTHYDTFITFYRDGNYLYSKSINYSLEQIYNRFCEISGATVNEKEFMDTLQSEGMKATDTDYQNNIMKLFGEIFISINDIIIYTKRAYDLAVIDQIYIGSSLGPIIGVEDYAQDYLGLNSFAMEFDFGFNTDEWYVDQMQSMLILNSLDSLDTNSEDAIMNLTIYPRPPVFLKRTSGQFIVSTIAAATVALLPSAYYYGAAKVHDTHNNILHEEERGLNVQVVKYKSVLSKKSKDLARFGAELQSHKKIFSSKEKTLKSVYDKKMNYRLKSEQLESFAHDLNKFNVKTYKIGTNNDRYSISLVSMDDNDITKLIGHISDKYSGQLSNIDIEHIKKDSNSTFYQGTLKVDL